MWTKKSAEKVRKQVAGCLQNLYQSSPEVRTFGTLISSTKVFSLINGKTLCQNDPLPRYFRLDILDSVPRDLRLRT